MELEKIRSFVTVVTEGGLGRAAPQLFVSISGLSRRIHDLEKEIGVELFERSAKGVRLTPAGEQILHHAQRLLAEYDELLRCAQQPSVQSPHIRIGIAPAVEPALRDLAVGSVRANRSDAVVDLVPGGNTHLIRQLLDGELQLALLHQHPMSAKGDSVRLLVQPTHIALAKSLPQAQAEVLWLRDLADLAFVTSSTLLNGHPIFYAKLRTMFEESGVTRLIDVGPPDSWALREHVAGAAGFAITAEPVGADGLAGSNWDSAVCVREVADLDLTLDTFLAWNRAAVEEDPSLRKLVDTLIDEFRLDFDVESTPVDPEDAVA